jgi:DNA helicase-2/ATP-dependent DNA helicase PcrA
MLVSAGTPEAETRLENLGELMNAAGEAALRGEGVAEFLDHAALVADADQLDERAQVSLLTMHNAKGLEWPVVFIAGMEEGLFPHSRSRESEAMLEEERRLCYVAMTRAQRRLFLTWACSRRRFGGGSQEPQMKSRFLLDVPQHCQLRLDSPSGPAGAVPEVDLYAEQSAVREAARRNSYTGKTYNSLENIAQFFVDRGLQPPPARQGASPVRSTPLPAPPPKAPAPGRKAAFRTGVTVVHPRFGKGLILRKEGEGDEAKLTISFPGKGVKKMVAKYAGLTVE